MVDKNIRLGVGDRIRLEDCFGNMIDYTVEEFRQCLGIFTCDEAREAGDFTPLCQLYGDGPDSEARYISNYRSYRTNQVPLWMNIPKEDR